MSKLAKRKLALKVFGKKGSKQRRLNAIKAWKTRSKHVDLKNKDVLRSEVKRMIAEYLNANIDTIVNKIA